MTENRFRERRHRMVDEYLVSDGIVDTRVLAAMRRVPRHEFVPADWMDEAYSNRPLPIASGQTISQPLMVALTLQAAQLTGSENVLEVGAGSGYQAALLAELSARVTSIERIPKLAERARRLLKRLGYWNATVVTGDGSEGYPSGAPYDRIIVAAGAPRTPRSLIVQLAAPGRLIVPVGDIREQKLLVVVKDADGSVTEQDEGWCAFVPLIGAEGWPDQTTAPEIDRPTR